MSTSTYSLTALSLSAIALVNFGTAVNAGLKRGKHGIKAPAVTGHPEFEAALRIQGNTVEQTMIVVPALLSFAYLSGNDRLAGGLGLTWALSRVLFALGYPNRRELGFTVGVLSSLSLIAGSMYYGLKQYKA